MALAVEGSCGIELERDKAAHLRLEPLLAFDSPGDDVASTIGQSQVKSTASREPVLDVEFVAIFW